MKFKSDKQRKAVMAKLKGGQKVHRTKKYNRYRIRDPDEFKKSSFRTIDIGRPKRHQLIRGKLKKTGKYATQAVIVEKGTPDGTTREIIKKAKKYPKSPRIKREFEFINPGGEPTMSGAKYIVYGKGGEPNILLAYKKDAARIAKMSHEDYMREFKKG